MKFGYDAGRGGPPVPGPVHHGLRGARAAAAPEPAQGAESEGPVRVAGVGDADVLRRGARPVPRDPRGTRRFRPREMPSRRTTALDAAKVSRNGARAAEIGSRRPKRRRPALGVIRAAPPAAGPRRHHGGAAALSAWHPRGGAATSPDGSGRRNRYDVESMGTAKFDSKDWAQIGGFTTIDTNRFQAPHLVPGMAVRFRARARNHAGWGPWSDASEYVMPIAQPLVSVPEEMQKAGRKGLPYRRPSGDPARRS